MGSEGGETNILRKQRYTNIDGFIPCLRTITNLSQIIKRIQQLASTICIHFINELLFCEANSEVCNYVDA